MRRMLKFFCAAALIAASLPLYAPAAGAADAFLVTETKLSSREEGLDIRGSYPVVSGVGNASLEAAVNEKIDTVFGQKKAEAKNVKAKSLVFSYTLTEANDVTSILLYTVINTATVKKEVNSVNFSRSRQSWVAIDDAAVLGPNGASLADKVITKEIRSNPGEYYQNFTGVTSGDAFAVENDGVKLYFDAFKLAPGSRGEVSFKLERQRIVYYWLPKERYLIDASNYDLRMIPLRTAAEALGYTVTWSPGDANSLVIVDRGDDFMVTLTIGKNEYVVSRPSAPERTSVMALEAAPELTAGVTYVPISFFDQILELVSYSIDENGGVVFATYVD
ncbi:MAG: copper amine oxidase N-terminal domain-containing protein [Firmicutes bacterium]|nr:copper amine oxidase N-terminal domain-containing protein [Bacillota bacterium]